MTPADGKLPPWSYRNRSARRADNHNIAWRAHMQVALGLGSHPDVRNLLRDLMGNTTALTGGHTEPATYASVPHQASDALLHAA